MPTKQPWTDEEIQLLRDLYPVEGISGTLPARLGRSPKAIKVKAQKMGVQVTAPSCEPIDPTPLEESNRVFRYLKRTRTQQTIYSIADALEMAPGAVRRAIADLRANHATISVLDEEEAVLMHVEARAGEKRVLPVEKHFGSSREVAFGVVSDLHYSNVHSREELIDHAYENFKREGVSIVFNPGNMIDGEAPFNTRELLAWGIEGQVKYLIDHAPRVEGITTYFVTGNDHEGWLAKRAGINIGQKIEDDMKRAGREDWVYLSHVEGDVQFQTKEGGAVLRVMHPGAGSAYATSYRLQKIIESLTSGEKPHVIVCGHYHKSLYANVRNVHALLAGTLEDQTPFMRLRSIEAHVGYWIVRMTLGKDGTILKFTQSWYPFMDRQVYQVNRDYPVQSTELRERVEGKPAKVF